MQQLSNNYLYEIAHSIANVSAFLGGFAATFVAALLSGKFTSRAAFWTIALGTLAAVLLIVTVMGTTSLTINLHPGIQKAATADYSTTTVRLIAFLSFLLGMFALLGSLGLSGFIYSRRLGWITSTASVLGLILILLVL